jgi:hypothetical protein
VRLPEPARSIAGGLTECVSAARSRKREEFQQSAALLATLNPEQVGVVLGAVVRSLLEDAHPDGLSGDDVQAVLERCVRSSAGWLPHADPSVLVALLIGALGVHDGESRPLSAAEVALHAPLLVADLLALSGRGLADCLDAAFAEIARAETMEMP